MHKYGPIYKKTSSGAIQQWSIRVVGTHLTTEFGQVGGAIQFTEEIIKAGKNLGRANETTPEAQADAEAKSRWEKQLKKDYVRTLEEAQAGTNTSDLVEGGVLPMLAQKYSEHAAKIKFPAYVQPKLDGHRCIAVGGRLWSRTRKEITGVPHVSAAVWESAVRGVAVDGELYNHDYRTKFEQLSHFIRQKTPAEGYEVVQYHIYDVAMGGSFRERWGYLHDQLGVPYGQQPLRLVETRLVQDEDELMLAFEDFLAQGYEGAIVRNADGLYVNKRSYDLQKIKSFLDDEYEIVGIDEGRGKLAGHGIFKCLAKNGKGFNAKMKGDTEALKMFFQRPNDFIGKYVTVKYQGLSADGIPRFPVAWRLRDE